MNPIRWTIVDRATGRRVTVAQPSTAKGRDNLREAIGVMSRLAMRGGPLYGINA